MFVLKYVYSFIQVVFFEQLLSAKALLLLLL